MYEPRVSIIIPAYRAANYLAEAIESALAQTYSNIEIIVVNDGSPDDGATAAVAAQYGDRIRYFEKTNGGSSSALNEGICRMTGEWFSWLSHDDLYYPTKVEKQIKHLQNLAEKGKDPRQYVLFTEAEVIDSTGHILRKPSAEVARKRANDIAGFSDNRYLIADPRKYSFNGCSCLVHRNVFDQVGMFDENLRLINDLDMWYRIFSKEYHIVLLPDILVKNRIHMMQVSRSIGYSKRNPEQLFYLKRNLQWLKDNCCNDSEAFLRFGKMAYMSQSYEIGDKAFQHLIEYHSMSTVKIAMYKTMYKSYASIREFAKKIYINLFIMRK